MIQKPAETQEKVHELIQTRWSPRAFDVNKPVSRHDLIALLEAARWAPSCFNDQPWRFIVCDKGSNEIAWQNAFSTLVEKNQRWAKNAPVLILVVAMDNFNHNGQPNGWGSYDTGAAATSLCLQATALCLCTHQMGGFSVEKAREVFKIPADCQPKAMVAIGYQAEVDSLDDDFRAMELAARSRTPIEDKFFDGAWGKGMRVASN